MERAPRIAALGRTRLSTIRTGGSIDGTIAACDVNLAAATADTIIIAGHGQPVSNKSELKEFRDMLVGRAGESRDA